MDELLESVDNGIATLTMNRPEKLNAVTRDMLKAMRAKLEGYAADPAIGAVILTGAGRAFCSGGDVGRMAGGGSDERGLEQRIMELRQSMEVSRILHELPKPTIAMIRGHAAGAGLSLALACDLRIAGESAKLTTAFVRVGLSGDYGGTYYLTKLVGSAKARELYMLSPTVDAGEAYRLNMVNRVVPDEALEAETMVIARRLADSARVTLSYIKRNMLAAEAGDFHACLDSEANHHARCSMTEDHLEASRAFVEKRKPAFKGR